MKEAKEEPVHTERELFRSERTFNFTEFDDEEELPPRKTVLTMEREREREKPTIARATQPVISQPEPEKPKVFKPSPIISPVYASKPDSIGIPMKGVSVACFEPETNKLLTVGEEGEICLKSDSVFKEYLGNEEETKKVKQIHENGEEWIHTGDLGYIDSDGYVYAADGERYGKDEGRVSSNGKV